MSTKKFSAFRFQIIPREKRLSFLYDINESIKKKNSLFADFLTALQNKTSRTNSKYAYSMIKEEHNKYLFVYHARRNVHYFNEQHERDSVLSYPPAHLLIDNDPSSQLILVESSKDYTSPNALIKMFAKDASKFLENEHLCIKIMPIYMKQSFWEFVENNHDSIRFLRFTLITPNMSNISGGLSEDLKCIAKDSKAASSELTLKPEYGAVLNINQNNRGISDLANYTSQGGGTVHARVNGSKLQYDSNDHQMTTELTEKQIAGDLRTLFDIIKKLISKND